jgi:aminoglycoside phosphotransferase (APT) family kinase protein
MADGSELSEAVVEALLQKISPQSRFGAIALMPGSFSNITHVVDVISAEGLPSRLVVRRYPVANDKQRVKARREYEALVRLHANKYAVAQPLYLDEQGKILGMSGIVTSFMPGKQVLNPTNPEMWARQLAQMLARIHSFDCDPATMPSLMNSNTDAAGFLRYKEIPKRMSEHPDGQIVWDELREQLWHLRPVRASFTHLDYWVQNILWQDDRISAVVDWEEASYGDPAIDVGYARKGFYEMGRADLADLFLEEYEQAVGRHVENLGFWELAASIRSMPDPAQKLKGKIALGGQSFNAADVREWLRMFIRDARERMKG